MTLTRNLPLDLRQSALLFIDVQNFAAYHQGGEFSEKYAWFFSELERRVIPNMQAIQAAARAANIEGLFTTVKSLTLDGRARSLDYKITGFNVPKGS